jgi:aminoglycoside phosphotransferase
LDAAVAVDGFVDQDAAGVAHDDLALSVLELHVLTGGPSLAKVFEGIEGG